MQFAAGAVPMAAPPFTLGHENAGWVAATGAGVTRFQRRRRGGRVLRLGLRSLQAVLAFCGERVRAHGGDRIRGGGLGRDGGMAEFMLVPDARLLVPLGDLDPVQAAPLTDAGLTPYHAIKQALPVLTAEATAVVIGVGGLGHLAVQILRATTAARVIALDISDDKLARRTRRSGATDTSGQTQTPHKASSELTRGVGADAVFDSSGPTTRWPWRSASPAAAATSPSSDSPAAASPSATAPCHSRPRSSCPTQEPGRS